MSELDYILNLSGGKDSTWLAHEMLERGEKISAIVFVDYGLEFPEMYDHLRIFEQKIDMKVWRIAPRLPFEWEMGSKRIKTRDNSIKYGRGWPSNYRWCTREKVAALDHFAKSFKNPVHCIGYASDEDRSSNMSKYPCRYPLQEYGITEKQALENCYQRGYYWGGLYHHFSRVSCFCCPQKSEDDIRKIRRFYPDLWAEMLRMDLNQPNHAPGFKNGQSVHDLENKYEQEDRKRAVLMKNLKYPNIPGQTCLAGCE